MDIWFPLNNPIKPCSVLDKMFDTNEALLVEYFSRIREKTRTLGRPRPQI